MYQAVNVEKHVFRAYDIRGIVNAQFNENAFYTIGLAIAYRMAKLQRSEIVVGRDGRLTSNALANALIQGLTDSGMTVFDLGMISTPMMYYAAFSEAIDCGIMITGSHNPAPYNGIKMVLAGTTLAKADIQLLYTYITDKKWIKRQGKVVEKPINQAYIQRITQDIRLSRPLKVVVDAGNGVAGPIIVETLNALGCTIIPLFCDVDGHFPNHHPDPSVEKNLIDLKRAVLLHQADIGLAFDGDADRLGVITNNARIIWPDRLIMFYAQALLKSCPQASIVYDVKCSANVEKFISAAGGIPHMCPTGHSLVKAQMRSIGAALAGEMSGHIFFQDRWYGFDDALYSACRLLEIIADNSLSVEAQFALIPDSINTPEINIAIEDEYKFSFMEQFCKEAHFPEAAIIRIDGLRVEFNYGWGLIRASNTTPCLVARFEAESSEALQRIQSIFKTQLLKINHFLAIPF